MQFEKIYNKGQATLFDNKYLERLTKTNPFVIWGMYVPLIISMLYLSTEVMNLAKLDTLFVFIGGIIFWTLFEYIIHRFVFHFISESEKAMKVIYILHGNHHQYPRDKERLFMPALPSLIIASAIFGLMYFIGYLSGVNGYVFAFFPGFVLGYLLYGTMHYAIHAWNPPYRWMKPLWRNHHLHHYKEAHRGFGVSTTIWDRLFGTMYDLKKEKVDEEKMKDLLY